MLIGIIYRATSPKGKKYIGQTSQPLISRIHGHYLQIIHNTFSYFHNAIRKYGKENIKWEIIEKIECETLDELHKLLNEREIYHIANENSLWPNGYNLQEGGGRYVRGLKHKLGKTYEELYGDEKSKIIKQKISKKVKGRKCSPEEIQNKSLANTGKKRTEESKDKIRKSLLGSKHTEERRKHISNSLKGKKFSQNFGPIRYGKDNPRFKDIPKEDEIRIIDLYVNKGLSVRKIENEFKPKFGGGPIVRFLKENNLYRYKKIN